MARRSLLCSHRYHLLHGRQSTPSDRVRIQTRGSATRNRPFSAAFRSCTLAVSVLGIAILIGQQCSASATTYTSTWEVHIDSKTLGSVDSLSASPIRTSEQAASYVGRVADLYGAQQLPQWKDLAGRLAAGELLAAQDPSALVSDDQVATAFNFLSENLQVRDPAHLVASDVADYRTVMSAIYPHLFGSRTMIGSRPVSAVILLYLLVYNGGVSEGARRFAATDPRPGSLRIDLLSGRIERGPTTGPRIDYQVAMRTYLQRHNINDLQALVSRVAQLLALPERR